jgi:hypothetical protein
MPPYNPATLRMPSECRKITDKLGVSEFWYTEIFQDGVWVTVRAEGGSLHVFLAKQIAEDWAMGLSHTHNKAPVRICHWFLSYDLPKVIKTVRNLYGSGLATEHSYEKA